MIIYPAIDLLSGRCVRLVHGDYNQVTEYGEPGEVARTFVAAGATWIHAVDLDGAKAGQPVNLKAVRAIVAAGVPVQLGGGLRTEGDLEQVFDLGVQRVILGSVLVRDPAFASACFAKFGDRIVAGIDARNGMVATQGWLETSTLTAGDLAKAMVQSGAQRFVFTDIGRDGTLAGPNLEALADFMAAASVPVIASGGVSGPEDIDALRTLGPEGVIVGKAIYEGRVLLKDLFQ
jgi:phosphoribosylformimino-5-aminoimidazole carboxamide ribotide isomerase